jgi:hypothetical protein
MRPRSRRLQGCGASPVPNARVPNTGMHGAGLSRPNALVAQLGAYTPVGSKMPLYGRVTVPSAGLGEAKLRFGAGRPSGDNRPSL